MLPTKVSLDTYLFTLFCVSQVQVLGMELGSSGFVASTFAQVSLNID